MAESEIIFSHPAISPSLKLHLRPDQITWAYGLNTASFPTYGGEVVQILSMYFDDMTITGTVKTYSALEKIYGWFIKYMQIASQGTQGNRFNPDPVTFKYKHRGWEFQLYPKSLPSFRYGRDVVAPEWSVTAAVFEPDQSVKDLILGGHESFAGDTTDLDIGVFHVTAEIGYQEDNPFSGPSTKDFKKNITAYNDHMGKWYNNIIKSWTNADFADLSADYSKPAFLRGGLGVENTGTNTSVKKVKK